jgi:RNA polymerase sigma-70 factor (ECF subfamily)
MSVAGFPAPSEVLPVVRRRSADDAVVEIYESVHAELYSFIARSIRDDAEAEDLLQEAFLRLTREARAGRLPEQSRAWLYRVATNLIVSRSRRRGTVTRWLERFGKSEDNASIGESPEAGLIQRERAGDLERALAVLPADARLGLLLSGQGFSGAEIATALGRSNAATRTLLCRARVKVRAVMEGEMEAGAVR